MCFVICFRLAQTPQLPNTDSTEEPVDDKLDLNDTAEGSGVWRGAVIRYAEVVDAGRLIRPVCVLPRAGTARIWTCIKPSARHKKRKEERRHTTSTQALLSAGRFFAVPAGSPTGIDPLVEGAVGAAHEDVDRATSR
jgi:hypothetical protein